MVPIAVLAVEIAYVNELRFIRSFMIFLESVIKEGLMKRYPTSVSYRSVIYELRAFEG